jgi:hypothetical protein
MEEEKTIEENLKDEVFFRYNLLLRLERLEQIMLNILQTNNILINKILQEESGNKEEKESVFR